MSTARTIRFVRHWHARAGVLAGIFFLFLATTGLALNHTQALGLAKREISLSWLMRWYGLRGAEPSQAFLFEHGYLAVAPGHWVMDGRDLPEPVGEPVGVVEVEGVRYLATAAELRLYQPDGSLVDKLAGAALPAVPIRRIGSQDGDVVIETPSGAYASRDGLSWRPIAAQTVAWGREQRLPASAREEVAARFAPHMPLERLLLDLHSGRIFGRFGPFFMDGAALVLLVLSLSGIWIYWRSLRKRG